jgi:tetratricopeptide (TPR) repeat protein
LDPQFTDAWLGLADLLGFSGLYADDAEEGLAGKQRAREIFERVLAKEPDNVTALIMRGIHRYAHWWDWSGAAADFAHAAALEPQGNAWLVVEQARLAAAQGRLQEAIALDQRANEIQPLNGNGWTTMAYHYLGSGDYARAREAGNQAVRRQPLDEHAHYYLGLGELMQGRAAAALPHFNDSAHELRLTGQALAHHTLGDRAATERDVQLLINRYGHILPYNIAEVYAWRGETDKAFQWLDRAVELHDASFMYLEFDPLLAGLRADPRFAALLAKLNLPPLERP